MNRRAAILTGSALILTLAGGNAAGSEDDFLYNVRNFEAALKAWQHRDGEISWRVSDFFCDYLISRPVEFLSLAEKNRAPLRDWITNLPKRSLKDFGGCVDVERRRQCMVRSLLNVQPQPGSLGAELLKVLESAKAAGVD